MDLHYTDEQKMLRTSLRRFLADRYPTASKAGAKTLPPGIWAAFANELGLLGAAFPESQGGLGGGPVELMIIMEELGRALVREPYVETVVVAAEILARSKGAEAKRAFDAILAGELLVAYAWAEPNLDMDFTQIATTAVLGPDCWWLSGKKSVVTAAPWASSIIVAARTDGEAGDKSGLSLFLVEKSAPGISVCDYMTIDGRQASDIEFLETPVSLDALLGKQGGALQVMEEIADRAIAALGAESIGLMNKLHEDTMAYIKERKQFGRPLATFQVLQHRVADMLIEIELATSSVLLSTLSMKGLPDSRTQAASVAKAMTCAAGRFVGQNAVQLHGGMGMTDELAIGHYMKRLMAIAADFGDEDYHRSRLTAF